MAKIRSIKPESCTSETLSQVSERAALLFAYLPCFCDDEGRMKYNPKLIKSQMFPLRDDIDFRACERLINELEGVDLVQVYEVDGKMYLLVTNFLEHQKPIRPKKSKLPPPPAKTSSSNAEAMPKQCSSNAEAMPQQCSNGSGNGSGIGNGNSNCNVEQARPVIDYLNEKTGRNFKPSTKATQSRINARFQEGYSLDDFKAVIDSRCDKWLRDKKMEEFLRPETLFGSKFEGYLQSANGEEATDEEIEQYAAYL